MPAPSPKSEITPRTVIPYQRRRISWRSLNWQLMFITILPVTALVLLVAIGSLSVHQNAMRSMVGERDLLAVRAAAATIEEQIAHRLNTVESLAILTEKERPEHFQEILQHPEYLSTEFDAGLAIFSLQGQLIAASNNSPDWEEFSTSYLESTPDPVGLWQGSRTLIQNSQLADHDRLIMYALAISPSRQWIAAGATTFSNLFDKPLEQAFSSKPDASIVMVDSEGRLLYKLGEKPYLADYQQHPGVQEALAEKSGVLYIQNQEHELVVAYAPVGSQGWALVFQEAWELIESPTLRISQLAPLVLAPVLILTIVALGFGAKQIITPLQKLESKASMLAWGDFEAIKTPVGGIDEIRQLQDELVHMAQKVRSAQKNLHSYIGAITSAQEDERLRLARELHDETIQALIALKQRAQLYQITVHRTENESTALAEIATVTEETIQNLRRLIHALRPIYLEDLGLTTALEMLARETAQTLNIPVDFEKQGIEKRLPTQIEMALFRMVQEAFRNIERHAQATGAVLSLKFDPQTLTIEISDNGIGFEVPKNPSEFAPGGHFGLLGMYERAELIGSSLEIQSAPDKGTSIRFRISTSSR